MSYLSSKEIYLVLTHIIASLIASSRTKSVDWRAVSMWSEATLIGEGGCELDSLECAALSVRIFQFFQCAEASTFPSFHVSMTLKECTNGIRKSLEEGTDKCGFLTSGSTGEAKCIVQDIGFIRREVSAIYALLDKPKRIISVVPSHHLYGFILTVVLPKEYKLVHVDAKQLMPYQLLRMLEPNDVLVGYPDFWMLLVELGITFPENITVVSSTSPCNRAIKESMTQLGTKTFIEIYGSTETSGVGFRMWPKEEYSLFDHWSKKDADTLVAEPLCKLDDEKEVHVMDHLEWVNISDFQVVGRKDAVVQVGGVNVSITRVEECISSHPLVSECRVRKMKNNEGNRLKTFIILDIDEQVNLKKGTQGQSTPLEHYESEIRDWANSQLSPVERPKHYSFGQEFPAQGMGKLSDWPLV